MTDPYIGELKLVAFDFAPHGWAFCNGQILPINQNQALFSLLGTTYGGNGQTTFALPDLRGMSPIHVGQRPGGSSYSLGQTGGEATHVLGLAEMAQHYHTMHAYAGPAGNAVPTGDVPAKRLNPAYSTISDSTLADDSVAAAGGAQPHENTPPYLTLTYVIALQGIFPPRN